MVPDGESLRIWLEVRAEPVGGQEKLFSSFEIAAATEEVVVPQAVLRNRDWVVLPADAAVIIEDWDAVGIVGTRIVGLLGEQHVIFAEFAGGRIWILCGSLVPEGEMALPPEEVGTENASIVAETGQRMSCSRSPS